MTSLTDIQNAQRVFQPRATEMVYVDDLRIWLKREDGSFCGSHKFRPMAWQMEKIKKEKLKGKNIIVPTSGNAGIAAAMIGRELGIEVWCFVHPQIDRAKAAQIQAAGGRLFASERSVRYSGFVHKTQKIPRLRQSFDDWAVEGYWSLASELSEQLPDCDAIFNFATSGTSTLGIYRGYEQLGVKCPELHVVRRSEEARKRGSEEVAGKGCLGRSRRDKDLMKAIEGTGGSVHDTSSMNLSSVTLDTSPEGKACVVAARRYLKDHPGKKVVVICSGRGWEDDRRDVKMERCEEVFGALPGGVGILSPFVQSSFDLWNVQKKIIDKKENYRGFKDGEIFYVHLGRNIGFEQNGKGDAFIKPVLVLRKFSNHTFIGVPLSRSIKRGIFYFPFSLNGSTSTALLSQVRLFDTKKLLNKIGNIRNSQMMLLKQKLRKLLKLSE